MRRFLALLLASASLVLAQEPPLDHRAAVTVVFADPAVLASARTFDLSPRGNLVIQTADNLFDVGANRYLLEAPQRIDHFAFMRDGALLAISGEILWVYEPAERRLVEAVKVPAAAMRLAAGTPEIGFVYGGKGATTGLYAFGKSGQCQPLYSSEAISALVAVGDRAYLAVNDGVYAVASGEPLAVVLRGAPQPIVSLAYHDTGTLLFSTRDAIYGVRGGKFAKVIEGIGGPMKCQAARLHVLTRDALIRIDHLGRALIWEGGKVQLTLSTDGRR